MKIDTASCVSGTGSKCFLHVDSLRFHTTLWDGYCFSPHFIDEETEAQRDFRVDSHMVRTLREAQWCRGHVQESKHTPASGLSETSRNRPHRMDRMYAGEAGEGPWECGCHPEEAQACMSLQPSQNGLPREWSTWPFPLEFNPSRLASTSPPPRSQSPSSSRLLCYLLDSLQVIQLIWVWGSSAEDSVGVVTEELLCEECLTRCLEPSGHGINSSCSEATPPRPYCLESAHRCLITFCLTAIIISLWLDCKAS